jgi:hypothetical protein
LAAGVEAIKAPSYLLTILGHLSAGLRQLGSFDSQLISDTRASLSRLLPYVQLRQARPAVASEVRRLEAAEPSGRGLLVRCLWQTAARFSDWSGRLPAESVVPGRGDWFVVNYRRTKSSTRGAARMALFRLPPPAARRLRRLIARTPPCQALFRVSYARMRAWVALRAPGLSMHSFRRGAVQAMLDAEVPAKEVARLTGHRSMATMYGYAHRLPQSARRAMSRAYAALL